MMRAHVWRNLRPRERESAAQLVCGPWSFHRVRPVRGWVLVNSWPNGARGVEDHGDRFVGSLWVGASSPGAWVGG